MPSLSKTRHLSREHARRFVVRRHMLAPPRALPATADSVLAVTRRLGSLQFDPIDVPGGHAWTAIPGFPALGVVDDNLRITTASAPLWGGSCGFAFSITQALNRRGAFDGLEAKRLT